MSSGAFSDSPNSLRDSSVADLFDRLDVLVVLLSENTDRWAAASSGAATARILDERFALHREREEIERELRRRTGEDPRRGGGGVDGQRRADALDQLATRHEDEVVVHEQAATFFEERGFPRPAARQRQQGEAVARLASEERAESARLRASTGG